MYHIVGRLEKMEEESRARATPPIGPGTTCRHIFGHCLSHRPYTLQSVLEERPKNHQDFPDSSVDRGSTCNAGDRGSIPGSGKIPWRRERLPTPVVLGFPCGSAGKEPACNLGDLGLIPELGRSPGEGKGYPLQYSGLDNSMDCIVHGVAKSQT